MKHCGTYVKENLGPRWDNPIWTFNLGQECLENYIPTYLLVHGIYAMMSGFVDSSEQVRSARLSDRSLKL